MTNLVEAIRQVGTIQHIVRITGDPSGIEDASQVPQLFREWEGGTAIQHTSARKVLRESGLPVSYVNIAAYIMDDFVTMFAPPLMLHRMICVPFVHRMAYMDPADIGKYAGAVLLDTTGEHIGTTINLNNGHDLLLFSEVATLLGDVLEESIGYDGTPERFSEINGDVLRAWVGRDDAVDCYIEYLRFEASVAHTFEVTDIVERLIGQEGKSLREWFEDNRAHLRPPVSA